MCQDHAQSSQLLMCLHVSLLLAPSDLTCGLTPQMPVKNYKLLLFLQSTKAVYNRILDLKIATPQVVINFCMFLEEHNYFEESFKAYERGVALFKWPHVFDIWNTYLTKFIKRYVSSMVTR